MRRPIIAGNWKMNMTPSEARALVEELKPLVKDAKCEVVVCPPYVDLSAVSELIKDSNIRLGAQNIHWAEKGAFTGEVSANMLKELGVEYAIIGHSERRQYFGETDATVNQRVLAAVKAGLTPIICVGESLAQREHDLTETYVAYQVAAAFSGLTAEQAMHCVIAYEPLWAIGTGNTATSAQAQEVCASIRATLGKLYDLETAKTISILYGGSMNAGNAAELLAQPDIDGGLIGGASLKPVDFSKIVAATAQGACE